MPQPENFFQNKRTKLSRYSLFSRLSAIERIMTSCQWNSNNGNPDCQYRVYTIFPIWNFMTPGTLNNPMTNFIKVYFFLIKYVLRTVYCLNKSMFKLYVKKMRNAPHAIFFVIMTYTSLTWCFCYFQPRIP